MKTVVLSDTHNREFVVKNLFTKIGLMNDKGERNEGFKIIQLGDLLSLGYGEQEAEFLKWIRPFIDVQLIGNHELPAIEPYASRVEFIGWEDRDRVAEQMMRSEFNRARMEGIPDLWIPATHVGKWLITHAGISIAHQKAMGLIGKSAQEIAEFLNEDFERHLVEQTPDAWVIDPSEYKGGVFWHRIQYLRSGYMEKHVPQIVGHTPYDRNDKFSPPSVQNKAGNLYCIDTPGDCCALITEDDGETWEMVRSDYKVIYDGTRNPTTVVPR